MGGTVGIMMKVARVENMRKMKDSHLINFLFVFILVFTSILAPDFVFSDAEKREGKKVVMLVFGASTCPNCIAQKTFLNELEKRYSLLEVKYYEVYNSKPNRELFARTAEEHGTKAGSVPAVFIAGKHFIGDTPATRKQIEQVVRQAIESAEKQKLPASEAKIENQDTTGSSSPTANQQKSGQPPMSPSSSLPAPECDAQAKTCKAQDEGDPWFSGGLQDGWTPPVKGTPLPDREKKLCRTRSGQRQVKLRWTYPLSARWIWPSIRSF